MICLKEVEEMYYVVLMARMSNLCCWKVGLTALDRWVVSECSELELGFQSFL